MFFVVLCPHRFSEFLVEQMDRNIVNDKRKEQEKIEEDCFEEGEDEDDEEDMKEEVEEDNSNPLDEGEKDLLREEFKTILHSQFVSGKDKEFDYR